MKIKKISKINNFGIFQNFDWDSNLSNPKAINKTYDFKDINIFYGRNYSGKTSLSKIIRSLETKTISPKYQKPNFEIMLDDNSLVTHTSLNRFNYPIYVYNSDFVKENLKFIHDDTQNVESFSITLGGDNQQILDRINQLKDELGSNEANNESGIYLSIKNKQNELKHAKQVSDSKSNELETHLSNKASSKPTSIRTQHNKFGDSNYNISKLRKEIELVIQSTYKPLTQNIKTQHEQLIVQVKKEVPPMPQKFSTAFSKIVNTVEDILKCQVGQINKIDELILDGDLNKWVETGLGHHKNRTTCAFCSNTLSADRLDSLRQHFDCTGQLI